MINISTLKKLKLRILIFLIAFIKIKALFKIIPSESLLYNKRKLNYANYITITLNMKEEDDYYGEKRFLNLGADNPLPSEILLDGSPINDGIKSVNKNYYLTIDKEKINTLIIKWNDKLISCSRMFYLCTDIISLDLSNLDTSSVTDMSNMFYSCTSLISLNVNNINTSMVKNMVNMFYLCSSLELLNIKNFNTSLVENMSNMFSNCKKLISLNINSFDTSSVTDMTKMFFSCTELTSLNLNNFNTSSVIYMTDMFNGCEELKSLKLDKFNTSSVINMAGMFTKCSSLKSLDLTSFDTSKVIYINSMFEDCGSLKSLNLINFNTSSVINIEYMFFECYSMTFLNIDNFNISLITDISSMFYGCSSLISLNLNSFNTSSITTMKNMFYKCSSLTSLNLDNFDTSSVINMRGMFYGCNSLISLSLNNFNTSSVIDLSLMFLSCSSLKSLNLNSFDTSSVDNMGYMFYNCFSLTSLNLNNFDTRRVTNMEGMFSYCSSLQSLDLSNFNFSNVENMKQMLRSCENLEFINISNYNNEKKSIKNNNIFIDTPETLVYCINNINDNINFQSIKSELISKSCSIEDCSQNWKEKSKKIVLEKNKCLKNCFEDDKYKYEYENICYTNCPNGTSIIAKYLCEKDNIQREDYIKICHSEDFFNSGCTPTNGNMIDNIIFDIKSGYMNSILNMVISNKNDFIIEDNNIVYQITSSYNQKNKEYDNISTIFLGECENILKEKYNIDQNESLIIFKYDYYNPDILIPMVGYEIFHPYTKEKLDLDYCNSIYIDLAIPVSINEKDIDKYNPNSEYYKNICNSYPNEKSVDMTLYDRKNEYNDKNMSICANDCIFIEYHSNRNKSLCKCTAQTNSSITLDQIINGKKLLNKFIDIKSSSNLYIFKCYNILFSKDGLKSNIGSYILLFIILIYLITIILFYAKGYNSMVNKIQAIILFKKKNADIKKIQSENNDSDNISNNINEYISMDNYKIVINKEERNKETSSYNNNNNTASIITIRNKKKASQKKDKYSKKVINTTTNSKSVIKLNLKTSNFFRKEINLKTLNDNNSKEIINYVDSELNSLNYKEALNIDKRSYFQYYWSLLKTKHILTFSFYITNDYNSKIIKIFLFFFSFSLFYITNTLFFTDKTMHKIYEDEGAFNFIYCIPNIIYSTIISSIINIIVKTLCLPENSILEVKKEKDINRVSDEIPKLIKIIKIKFVLFYIFCFICLIFFWYFISCFGAVYKNTQIFLIKDTLISFSLSLIHPFILNLLPGLLRIPSLRDPRECLYKLSKIIQDLL